MPNLTSEEEVVEYFLLTRLDDIEALTPDTTFKISLDGDEFLNIILEETKNEFRTTIRNALIKSYTMCNFNKEQLSEIAQVVKEYQKINISIDIPINTEIREINAEEHERKIVTFDCQVFLTGDERTETIQLLYRCNRCKEEYPISIYDEEPACPECETTLIEIGNAETETIKNIYVKDLTDRSLEIDSRTFTVKVHREQANQFKMNDSVRITGVFKSIPVKKRKRDEYLVINKIIIDAINIMSIEKEKTSIPTTEKTEKYKKLAEEGKLTDLLVKSFAYYVKGNEDQKLAVLLSMVGGVKTKKKRGRINVLIVGPSGSGKSYANKFIKAVSHKGCLTDMTGSSPLGLFFGAMDTPDGHKGLSAGPLVKYNGGHVFIDEFEKGTPEIYRMLLKAMEEGKIERSITGFGNVTAEADTTIIACGNPKFGTWNESLSILENLGLDVYMVSRFDIIIRLYDIPDEAKDYEKMSFMLDDANEEVPVGALSEGELNEILNYARTLTPKLTPEAIHTLSLFYSKRGDYIKEGGIPIDGRQGASLKRKAEAFAKLSLSESVTKEHAELAINFFKKELESFGMSMKDAGKMRSDGLTKYMKTGSKEEVFRVLFHELEKIVEDKCVFKERLIEEMVSSNRWGTTEIADAYIKKLYTEVKILIDQNSGQVRLV